VKKSKKYSRNLRNRKKIQPGSIISLTVTFTPINYQKSLRSIPAQKPTMSNTANRGELFGINSEQPSPFEGYREPIPVTPLSDGTREEDSLDPPVSESYQEPMANTRTKEEVKETNNQVAEAIHQILSQFKKEVAKDIKQGTTLVEPSPFEGEERLKFDGTNVTEFLREFEHRADTFKYDEATKIDRLLVHCDDTRREIIVDTVKEYATAKQTGQWAPIVKALRKRFRNQDQGQLEESEDALRDWLALCQATPNMDIGKYLDAFQVKIRKCIRAETIDPALEGWFLVKGLHENAARKVLTRCKLNVDRPRTFNSEAIYQVLHEMAEMNYNTRRLNPSKAMNSISRYAEFQPDTMTAPADTRFSAPKENQTSGTDKQARPKGVRGVRMPLGSRATQAEVDEIIDQFSKMSINRQVLTQWDARQNELINEPTIFSDIQRVLSQVQAATFTNPAPGLPTPQNQQPKPGGFANYQARPNGYIPPQPGNGTQTFQNNSVGGIGFPNQYQGSQDARNQAVSGAGFQERAQENCWACGNTNHRAASCPERQKLFDNGWIWWNPAERRLRWGTKEQDQGEIASLGPRGSQNQRLIQRIKQLTRTEFDPLVIPANWNQPQAPPVPTASISHMTVQMEPGTEAGTLSEEEYDKILRESGIVHTAGSIPDGPRAQVNSIQATPCEKPSTRKTENISDIVNMHVTAATKKSRVPAVRNSRDDLTDLFGFPRQPPKPRVMFEDYSDMMDVDYPQLPPPKINQKPAAPPAPKKTKLADTLTPDPIEIVQLLLQTEVKTTLGQVLSNMPDVRRRVLGPGLTEEENDKIRINALIVTKEEKQDDSDLEEVPRKPQINSIEGTFATFFKVEAENGIIIRAGPYKPHSSKAPEPMYNTTAQLSSVQAEFDEEPEVTTRTRRQYDRAAGIEHMRRECPRALVKIDGIRVYALLDTGAELNTMRLKTAEAAGLYITSLPQEMANSRMQAANGTHANFEGIVWRVPIHTGPVTILSNFFVVRALSNPVILGNPFLADSRAKLEHSADGRTYCTFYDEEGMDSTRFVSTHADRLNPRGVFADPRRGNDQGA
jgi:hypothetical protein